MRRPQLRRGLRYAVIDADEVAVFGETTHVLFANRLLPLLLPFIDGSRTVGEIAQCVTPQANVIDVVFGLSLLESSGCLASEHVEGEARIAANLLASAVEQSADGQTTVVVTEDYLSDDLRAAAARQRDAGRAWLPLKIAGELIWIGPRINPPETVCWNCVTARVRANQPWRAAVSAPATSQPDNGLPWITKEAWEKLSNGLHAESAITTIDPETAERAVHVVVSRAECPDCAGARPATLSPDVTPVWRDGGWRTVRAEETVRRLQHHVSPVTGVISRMERTSPPGGPPHVYEAQHLFPVPQDAREVLRTAGRRRTAGKGLSDAQARASALCEALERYSTAFRGDEPRIRASLRELGDEGIHPNSCANFSDDQFASREQWNAQGLDRVWVPVRFNAHAVIDWTATVSLTRDTVRYVPTAYCYYGYPLSDAERFCRADSNGTAAGNTLAEAILQGFLELAERDAAAIWWYNRAVRPGVAIESFGSWPHGVDQRYRDVGRGLTALDITTDLGIPTFVAVSQMHATDGPSDLVMGFGAHLDAEIALARAITEVDQWMPPLRAGNAAARCSIEPGDAPFLKADPAQRVRTRDDYVQVLPRTVDEAVLDVVGRATARGLETLVVDHSRVDVGLPVARVIVPGLRHFWPRLAPGRLYDVPVAIGWQSAVLAETALNPSALLI